MAWLPRWRRGKARDTRSGAAPAPGRADWRRLPPLTLTVRRAPLTTTVATGVLVADRMRPLIHPSGLSRRTGRQGTDAGAPVDPRALRPGAAPGVAPVLVPVVGRVAGLATVRADARPGRETVVPPPGTAGAGTSPGMPPAAPRLTPRVLASSGPRPDLLRAGDEYVGEPEPEPAPQAASAWLRMIESYRPPWAGDALALDTSAAPAEAPPLAGSGPVWSGEAAWSSEAAVPPPRPPRDTSANGSRPQHRRASLAESRRLGLGSPLRPPASPDAPPPVDAAAEPSAEPSGRAGERSGGAEDREGQPEPGADTAPAARPGAGADADQPADARPSPGPEVADPPRPPASAPEARPYEPGGEAVFDGAAPRTPPVPAEPDPPSAAATGAVGAVRISPGEAARPAAVAYRSRPGTRRPTPPPAADAVTVLPAEPAPAAPARRATRVPRADVPLTHPPARRATNGGRAEPEPGPTMPSAPPPQLPPSELADAVRRVHGVDVSDVPVHRGPEAAAEAHALGTRAFTRGGEVFLPADEGPLDQPAARGLLAHELTHAAQQRALGPALPSEDSDAGLALEAAAVATERWARGPAPAPPPGDTTPLASWTAPWYPAAASGVQRQISDAAAAPLPAPPPTAAPAHGAAYAAETVETAGAAGARERVGTPEAADGARSPGEAQRVRAGRIVPFDTGPPPPGERPAEPRAGRPLDLDDPGDVEELAERVYRTLHGRLRRELLVDRERAGRLRETTPFGWA